MRLVRIAIANVNSTVGAVVANADRVVFAVAEAARDHATVVALPEQVIGGYPQEDLIQWPAFVESQWRELKRIAKETAKYNVVTVLGVSVARDSHLYNCAAVLYRGAICGLVPKEKLPLYGIFYERRTLTSGRPGELAEVEGIPFGDAIFDFDFGTMAVEVCEDLWSPDGPMRRRAFAGAELVVNVSASPFRSGMLGERRDIVCGRARDNEATVAYANLVGGNDGLIFDGGGFVSQNGKLLHDAPRFQEGVTAVTVDLDRTRRRRIENTTWRSDQARAASLASAVHRVAVKTVPSRAALTYPVPSNSTFFLPEARKLPSQRARYCEELLDALALGIRDYFEKTAAFSTIGVALSGGRDSLLCLWLAHRAVLMNSGALSDRAKKKIVASKLRAFFMPSKFSSRETRLAAEKTASELGVPLEIIPIDEACDREVEATRKMLQRGESVTDLAKQNVQARVRAARMWNWANSARGLFLQTGNMSEKAVGYTTIGGDMEGALSVIANVPKTVINYLLDYLLETTNSEAIRLTLKKPASAELAPDMEDERDLMPFAVLDTCFALYAGEKMTPSEVAAVLRVMFPKERPAQLEAWAEKFAKLFVASIYKWVQAPVSLHVGNLDLERERALQLPVVQKTEWHS